MGDMPREDDGTFRLVREHAAFLHDRNQRPRHALSNFQRTFNFTDIVDDGFVEADVIDER